MGKKIVTKEDERPAGDGSGHCFYCHNKIGDEHAYDCVLVKKKVKIRAIIEYEVEVPEFWDKHDIEFHRNDSTWCADNMFSELDEIIKEKGCICPITNFEFISEVQSLNPHDTN